MPSAQKSFEEGLHLNERHTSLAKWPDLRDTALYEEAAALFKSVRQPGSGQISDAAEIHASPDGKWAVFAGTVIDRFEGVPPTRICQINLASGDTRVLTFGPNTDRLPKYCPDGCHIAFLSDRHAAGDFQLYLLDPISGAAGPAVRAEGWVEYLHWSPDGRRILVGVAGHGADVAGGHGAITSKKASDARPAWMPAVEAEQETHHWRRAWVYDLATQGIRQVSHDDINIWEAVWCGNDALAAVVSSGPGEGLWYSACLALIDINSGRSRKLYEPKDQLGWPAASPSGKWLAIVEAICSDRWFVAGVLKLLETASGETREIHTQGVDITHAEWRSDRHLLVAGHRGFETVIGLYDFQANAFSEVWASKELSTTGWYANVCGLGQACDCILVGEGFLRAPEVAVIRSGQYRSVRSFDPGYADQTKVISAIERVSWPAPDGLAIEGWLLVPHGNKPYPLIMNLHGGPVWHWRPTCLARRFAWVLMLLKRGYATFFPNPRGSSGRGQEFIRHVVGDLGGADTYDNLSGLNFLVEQGVADSQRLGVIGGSYGGFMTSWLVTQDARFAAAIPVAPHTNQVTERLLGNIPHFVDMFLGDRYNNPEGKYFERSSIMHAHRVRTPTLSICGALDRCTPPEEARQFHSALLENGCKSVLVTYPEEGHGVRSFPAAIDYTVRVVAWFQEHLGIGTESVREAIKS